MTCALPCGGRSVRHSTTSDRTEGKEFMNSARKIVSVVLLALLGVTIYGMVHTASQSGSPSGNGTSTEGTFGEGTEVDETPLLTAQALAKAPTSATELPFAQDALRLGIRRWIWRLRRLSSTRLNNGKARNPARRLGRN